MVRAAQAGKPAGGHKEGVWRFRARLWPLSHSGLTGLGGGVTEGHATGWDMAAFWVFGNTQSEVKRATTGVRTRQRSWARVHRAATANLGPRPNAAENRGAAEDKSWENAAKVSELLECREDGWWSIILRHRSSNCPPHLT